MAKLPYVSDLAYSVIEDLANEVDPEEKRFPTLDSLRPLQFELEQHIEAAIADWRLLQAKKLKEPSG